MWRRGVAKQLPAFFAFAVLSAAGQLATYAADVVPWVNAGTYWRVDWASLLVEGALKFILIGEIFAWVFGSYVSLAKLGRVLIRAVGTALIVTAAVAAAYVPQDGHFGIVSGAHLLEETIYLVESGLLAFIFLFAAYFRLPWNRWLFGITLGLGVSACVHLATWGVLTNGGLPDSKRVLLVLLNMATYHVCVLMWFYYLLVPQRASKHAAPPAHSPQDRLEPPARPTHEEELEVWNRELERLIHQ